MWGLARPPAPAQMQRKAALELTAAFADATQNQLESCRPNWRKVGLATGFHSSIVTNWTLAFYTEGK